MTALMLVAAGGLGVSIVLYRIVDRRERRSRASTKAKPPARRSPSTSRGGFALVIKDRYLRLLAVMLLVATVINTTGEYVIGKMATDRSETYAAEQPRLRRRGRPLPRATRDPRRAERLHQRFYSSYYTLVNLLSALLQAPGRRAAAHARSASASALHHAADRARRLVRAARVHEPRRWCGSRRRPRTASTTRSTTRCARRCSCRRARGKYKAKAAIDTFFFRMGDVIAGIGIVFLLVEVLGLGVRAFAVLNVVLAAVWLVLAYRSRQAPRPDRAGRARTREAEPR